MQKTLQNLTKAFVGESQARNRYAFYAKAAIKEGYEQIAGIFMETAEQEKTHAKRLFEQIQKLKKGNEDIVIEVSVPTAYGKTADNLKAAIAGENYEHAKMYPSFAKTAKEEGLKEIGIRLLAIARAEKHHAQRFRKLLDEIEGKSVFKKKKEVVWVCRECGYVHVGKEAPKICPSCDHPQAYYQIKTERY